MNDTRQLSNVEDIYELSPMQQGMLFQSLLAPASGVFFEQQVVRVDSQLNMEAFERAWQGIVDRTPVLRTSFHWGDMEKPVQVVHREVRVHIERLDWSATPQSAQSDRLERYLKDERKAGFDLDRPSLMRLVVIRISPLASWFVWHFHHMLLDGWSGQLLLTELLDSYRAMTLGKTFRAPGRRPFGDYVGWLQQQDMDAAETFWKDTLRGISTPTTIGVGHLGTGVTSPDGNEGQYLLSLAGSTSADLRRFARDSRLTLNSLVQGAWAILLSRYSQARDVLYGTVVSGRPAELSGIESMIGLFINTLPLRVSVPADARLLPWLKQLQDTLIQASRYQYVSPLQIQTWSEMPAQTKPFDSVLVFENFPAAAGSGTSNVNQEPFYLGRTDVDLTVIVAPEDTLRIKFLYNQRRFDAQTVAAMASHLQTLLQQFASAAQTPLGELPILSSAEREQLLSAACGTPAPGYDDKPLMQRLADRANAMPDAVAFIDGAAQTTLREVHERSNRLARYLIDRGVSPGAVVGVCLDCSTTAAVALLAVLKARAVYLPMDASYPRQRLAHMFEDSGAQLVLTASGSASFVSPDAVVDFVEAEAVAAAIGDVVDLPCAAPADLAYILYTSGSTGQPKGVAVEHRVMLNRLDWMWRTYPFDDDDVLVMRTPLNFVDSFWEILGGLLKGTPTVIAPAAVTGEPAAFVELLAEHAVTRVWFVPSYLEMLLEACPDLGARLPTVRQWWSGGEPLTADLYRRFSRAVPAARLFNVYGASELWDTTIFDPEIEGTPRVMVPIGRPIANTEVYVLDDRLEPAPAGVVGRLYFGGACLAREYVHRPELTARHFIPHPFSDAPGARLYDSGDLARVGHDGTVALVGRRDNQINLRGFRIEPGEIESMINQHPAVRESCVIARERSLGDVRLVACVVPAGDGGDSMDLLAHLADLLPPFMVPDSIVWLDAMPTTPSGKRDRARLIELEVQPVARGLTVAPRDPVEEKLAMHYRELLGIDTVGIHDDFFAQLGGHSLLATRLVSRLADEFGIELPLRSIFDAPTIAGLAAEIRELVNEDDQDDAAEAILSELEDMSQDEIDALLADVESQQPGAAS